MPNNEDEWIDEILIDILCEDAAFGVPVEGYIAAAKATIKAKLLEARLTQLKELEEACSFYSDFHGDPDIGIYALEQSEIRRLIAQLQASAPTKRGRI